MTHTVLICDDDPDILAALRIYLTAEGYRLLEARNGIEAIASVRQNDVHLVLLDIMMPQMDGLTAIPRIREQSNVPIILLTAKGEDGDKVLGLQLGADDYITKPFTPIEVLARVRSQLRRYTRLGGRVARPDRYTVGGVELDDTTRQVTVDGEPVALTPMEFAILRLLMQSPGRVYASAQIYEAVWNEAANGAVGAVAVHIRHLREKIEINPSEPQYIKVVWGVGYKMESEKRT